MIYQNIYPIIKKETLARDNFSFEIKCPEVAMIAECGQFVHIRVKGFILRRPISICEIDRNRGTIRLVFAVRGEGTKVLSVLEDEDTIDMIAPLGKGFTLLDKNKRVVVVGGGIGTPPLLEVAKYYDEPIAIIGFQSIIQTILKNDFEKISRTVVTSNDGSIGRKGFVTEPLRELLTAEKIDVIYACGPMPMLKSVAMVAEEFAIPCQVSMEERMGCGVGACLVCSCKTKYKNSEFKGDFDYTYSHVCKDGPVFNANDVIFE